MNYRNLSLSLTEALVRAAVDAPEKSAAGTKHGPSPFTITISREAGAQGSAVAAEIGQRLGWPVYDQNILGKIADEMKRPPSRLEAVDEQPVGWLQETIGNLLGQYQVGTDTYLKYLMIAVRGLGLGGKCVIVGRGANFILPVETTLRVRMVAAPEDRTRMVASSKGISAAEAAAWVEATNYRRGAFVKYAFKQDAANPHHYDLVLNMSRLSVSDAADTIIETLRRLEKRVTSAGAEAKPRAPALA